MSRGRVFFRVLAVYLLVSGLLLASDLISLGSIGDVDIAPGWLSVFLLIPLWLWYRNHVRKTSLSRQIQDEGKRGILLWILILFALALTVRVPSVLLFGMAYEKTPLVYLVVLFIVIVLGNDLSVFGFKTDNLGRSLLLGLVYYLVMGFLPLLLMGIGFYAYTGQILVENFDPALFLLIMPFMTLCVGISEEGLFRGYMQTSLDRVYSRRKAILAQSILFGLWHFIWHVSPLNIIGMLGHIVGSFVVGLLFGYFYGIAANLAPLVLAHGLINSVSYGFIENEGAFALIQNLPVTTQLLLFATPYILSLAMTFASTKFLIKTIMPHDTT